MEWSRPIESGHGRRARTRCPRLGRVLALIILAGATAAGCAGVKVHQNAVLDPTDAGILNATTVPPHEPFDLLHDGLVSEKADPLGAIRSYRDAALKALPYASAEGEVGSNGDGTTGARLVYRRAIEYAVQAADRVARHDQVRWTDVLASQGIVVRGKVSSFDPQQWDEALPARSFAVKGFLHHVARGGLGAPLVLSRTVEEGAAVPKEVRYFPLDLRKAATAMMIPGDSGSSVAVMELIDPVGFPEMCWGKGAGNGGEGSPLSYDMTTPLARELATAKLSILGPLGVLLPDRVKSRTGLYMQDPYEPGKIPVIFIHGLASSPQAWAQAMNELRGDPELRKRFQFWMFSYTTGNPILGSAAALRQSLNEVREDFDPEHRDPAFDRTVLVGHSMGGLLARLAVVSSKRDLWALASKIDPEKLEMDKELKLKLVSALIFEPVPTVERIIFISTPHRGSPLGYNFVGRLASSLIRLPQAASDMSKALVKAAGVQNVPAEFRNRRELTSVRQLASGNLVLGAMNRLPFDPRVKYHSIVGYNGKGNLETGGDGVVPYNSAHLDGAVSELIVRSDHSAQEKQASVDEVRRILVEHLGPLQSEVAKEKFIRK